MYIKSTREHISTPAHVWESIERHLGMEYADEVRKIIESVPQGYTSDEEVEKIEKEISNYEESLCKKDSVLNEIQELCNEAIEEIDNTKKLSRVRLKHLFENIYRKVYEA